MASNQAEQLALHATRLGLDPSLTDYHIAVTRKGALPQTALSLSLAMLLVLFLACHGLSRAFQFRDLYAAGGTQQPYSRLLTTQQ
jgi:hypothetical protein